MAVAVNTDGMREILGVATGPSEAEPFWTEFLRGLSRRCRVHFIRNALVHVGKGQRQAVLAMINTIFVQESAEAP